MRQRHSAKRVPNMPLIGENKFDGTSIEVLSVKLEALAAVMDVRLEALSATVDDHKQDIMRQISEHVVQHERGAEAARTKENEIIEIIEHLRDEVGGIKSSLQANFGVDEELTLRDRVIKLESNQSQLRGMIAAIGLVASVAIAATSGLLGSLIQTMAGGPK